MASATGVPENVNTARGASEEEPLLGRRGDASQMDGQPLYWNLWLGKSAPELVEDSSKVCGRYLTRVCTGTAPIAQAGIWIVCYFRILGFSGIRR